MRVAASSRWLSLAISVRLLFSSHGNVSILVNFTTMQSYNVKPFQTAHARWRAISHRDPAAHCAFVYGVTSTKVYCRPTCIARLARRANVVYYENRQQAEADGFRPCTKCKPDEAMFIGQREEVVVRTLDLIRLKKDSFQVEGGLKELARSVGVTPSYLCRVFKKTMGCTIGQYCKDFEGAVCGQNMASDPVRTSSISGSEASTGAWLPDPWAMTNSPAPPFENAASRPIETLVHPSANNEEPHDLNFDFSEWVWNEGFDFNDWLVPNNVFSHNVEDASSVLWQV